ncbi:MAG: pyridoxamine 5'-phosphate oxidase family protein [Planctomycetota bacterium]
MTAPPNDPEPHAHQPPANDAADAPEPTPLDARLRDHLPDILHDAWARLLRGAHSARQPFHTPVLATTQLHPDATTPQEQLPGAGATDSMEPDARVVVLRKAVPAERILLCHTDARSPKAAHLAANPRASWCFYDAKAKLQLRCWGHTTVHTPDALADARWDASGMSSRRCYLAPHPPGQPADHPSPNLPEHVRGRVPDAPETAPGRPHFAALQTIVDRLDWLYLHHAGHRRALFTWPANAPADTEPSATWLHV